MSHTVAASLSALVATGKDQCTVCYNYILLWKKCLVRTMRASFWSYFPQKPVTIKHTLSSVITY
jgi:hypothetical protein